MMPKVERVVSREGMPQPTNDLGTVVEAPPAGSRANDPSKKEFGIFYACQEAAGSKDSADFIA